MAETTKAGLFIAAYDVSNGLLGAPLVRLRLAVYTPARTITGIGTVTQDGPETKDFAVSLYGSYSYLVLLPPGPVNVVVGAFGLPLGTPRTSEIAGVAHLEMLLDEGWETGVATFRWHVDGVWNEIENARVTQVQPESITGAASGRIDLDATAGAPS